jgi:hypothetical protein
MIASGGVSDDFAFVAYGFSEWTSERWAKTRSADFFSW